MNNVNTVEGPPDQPTVLLNSYITPQGKVSKKIGHTLFTELPNAHSLFGGSVMFAVSNDKLYKIKNGIATKLCHIITRGSSVSYVEVNNKIYISCSGSNCEYDVSTGTIGKWGLNIPDKPIIYGIEGNLPPGTYSLCYTAINSDGTVSGNSPLNIFTFENQSMGVGLTNPPSNTLIWITDTSTGIFYLVGNTDDISEITSPYNTMPLPSLNVIPPPFMTSIHMAFGRIWGAVENKLYYSEPSAFDWFKQTNCFVMQDSITSIGEVKNGLLINSKNNTWILAGTDPSKMEIRRVGDGDMTGCVICADMQEGAINEKSWQNESRCPLWVNSDGIVVLNNQFDLGSLTNERLAIPDAVSGCGISITQNGIKQIIVTLKVPKGNNTDLESIFNEGRLSRTSKTGNGGLLITT